MMGSQSASASMVEEPKEVHSANAMEEYMKKKAATKEPANVGTKITQAKQAITKNSKGWSWSF